MILPEYFTCDRCGRAVATLPLMLEWLRLENEVKLEAAAAKEARE